MELRVLRKQNNSADCIICGTENNASMCAGFYEVEGDYVVAEVKGKYEHQSYPGRMHGGLISALLDETIGRAIMIQDPNQWGVTSELNVKFRKPVPLDQTLYCVAKIIKVGSRTFVGVGFIEDANGTLLAHGSATYVKLPLDKIADGDNLGWVLIEDNKKSFDIKNLQFFDKEQF